MNRVLLLTAAALTLAACERTEIEREIGYKGKARANPWLAAERFAGRMGRETRSVISWTAPGWQDAVWIMPAAVLGNQSFIRQTADWVRDGGHLILLAENAGAETDDWSDSDPPPLFEPPLFAMLEQAGIRLVRPETAAAETRSEAIEWDERRFQVDAASRMTVATDGEAPGVFASVKNGGGRITVITDGRLFRNRWIAERDHARLLDALIRVTDTEGAVGFMRGSGLSLWALLRDHLWPVLLGLAVWLPLWLWKNFTRFGPIESAAPAPVSRGYEPHLQALGDFHWRFDRGQSLLAPLREQVRELGHRACHQAGQPGRDFLQDLADRAKLPRERVARALDDTAPADSAWLTRIAADLQHLLQSLNQTAPS